MKKETFGLLQAAPEYFTSSLTTHVVVLFLDFDINLSLIGLLNFWAELDVFVECNAVETEVVWLSAEILRCIFNCVQ